MNQDQVFQIWLVIAGGIIGFLSSIGLLTLQAWINKRGKLRLFIKIIHGKINSHRAPGFHKSEYQSIALEIPLHIEMQNTSNETRVIRDLCVLLFHNNNRIEKMTQINYFTQTTKAGHEITEKKDIYFGNDGSYSFIVPPRSILHQECEFFLRLSPEEVKTKAFEELRLRYFDEKNKEHIFLLRKVDRCWEPHSFKTDNDWVLLHK